MSRRIKFIPIKKEDGQKYIEPKLKDAISYRANTQDDTWLINEQTTFAPEGVMDDKNTALSAAIGVNLNEASDDEMEGFDSFGMNYTVRYYRLIQAQLSANPPSVTPTPLTPDQEDQRRADAADDIVKYALRQYKMQEQFDLASSQLVLYGTAFIKSYWDKWAGDPIAFDKETLEITEMEGDLFVKSCDTWSIYLDPKAKKWDEVRFIFERKTYTEEEIKSHFPEQASYILNSTSYQDAEINTTSRSYADRFRQESMEEKCYVLYEYWEKGLPENGFQGRYIEAILPDGTCVTEPTINPHRFEEEGSLPKARLPYHIITDIDVTNQVYGNTFITYLTKIQDTMNRLDLQTLENIRSHGQIRMVLPEGAEVAGDGPSNDSWDIVEVSGGGGQKPFFANPPSSMPDIASLRANIMQGLNDISGTNESMFGQQSRETSGFSMQYATNQGNLIRRRLFNKYVNLTEGVYKDILDLIRVNWTTSRLIKVEGQEGAFNAREYEGADIDGGYDLVVQYGTSFSLDPMTRRQEIMQLIPLYKEAGRPMDELIKHIKLNDADTMDDLGQLSENRMREDIDTMVMTEDYVGPKEWQNHEGRLKFLVPYMETAEFDRLDEATQDLIIKHKEERMQMQAELSSGGAAPAQGGAIPEGGGTPMEGPPAEGAPPMDASMTPAGPAPV